MPKRNLTDIEKKQFASMAVLHGANAIAEQTGYSPSAVYDWIRRYTPSNTIPNDGSMPAHSAQATAEAIGLTHSDMPTDENIIDSPEELNDHLSAQIAKWRLLQEDATPANAVVFLKAAYDELAEYIGYDVDLDESILSAHLLLHDLAGTATEGEHGLAADVIQTAQRDIAAGIVAKLRSERKLIGRTVQLTQQEVQQALDEFAGAVTNRHLRARISRDTDDTSSTSARPTVDEMMADDKFRNLLDQLVEGGLRSEPARNSYLTQKHVETILYDPKMAQIMGKHATDVQCALLQFNPNIRPAFIDHILASSDRLWRQAVVGNPNVQPSQAERIVLEDPDKQVRAAAVRRADTTWYLLEQASSDSSSWVRSTIMSHANAGKALIERGLQDHDSGVRTNAAGHPQAESKSLERILRRDESLDVREAAAGNFRLGIHGLRMAMSDDEPAVRMAAAHNPSAPVEIIERALRDDDWEVRGAAIRNEKITSRLLKKVANDTREDEELISLAKDLLESRQPSKPKGRRGRKAPNL